MKLPVNGLSKLFSTLIFLFFTFLVISSAQYYHAYNQITTILKSTTVSVEIVNQIKWILHLNVVISVVFILICSIIILYYFISEKNKMKNISFDVSQKLKALNLASMIKEEVTQFNRNDYVNKRKSPECSA